MCKFVLACPVASFFLLLLTLFSLPYSLACNGVAHVIDAVLLPYWVYAPVGQLAIAVQEDAGLTTLVELLECADLVEAVDTTFGITVFAPNDDAFAHVNKEYLCSPDGLPTLTDILTYHVVPKVIPSVSIGSGDSYMTLQGESVTVSSSKSGVTVNSADVVVADVLAYNGIGKSEPTEWRSYIVCLALASNQLFSKMQFT
jgi:uncharacterized surface protein with fasciclin (FAS1) repeats